MDRREFFQKCGVACGLGAVASTLLVESCQKSTSAQGPSANFTIDLSNAANSALTKTGGSGSSNGVVVVNMGSSYIAVAQACTHNGCSVYYASSNFVCPCHGATFDLSGNVTSGPTNIPLKKYTVTKSGNILTVAG